MCIALVTLKKCRKKIKQEANMTIVKLVIVGGSGNISDSYFLCIFLFGEILPPNFLKLGRE